MYSSVPTKVMAVSNVWIRNCVDGFSQEIFENKWSLNAKNQQLTGFVCCVYSSWNSWNFGRDSRVFFLKFSTSFQQFFSLEHFSVTNGVLFISKVLWV